MTRPHLSPTQVEMAGKCMEQYRRRYVEGEKIPPGIAMLKGTGFHGGARVNFKQKLESHADLPAKEIAEIAASEFDRAVAGGYILTSEEESKGAKAVIGEAKDETVDMALFHAVQQAPDYQPVLVEERVTIQLPGSHDLLGILDLADDKDRVTDFKTSAKKKSQADADGSIQLTTYAASFKAKTGRIPLELRLDTVVKTKTKTERDVVVTARGEGDFSALASRINSITSAIQAGVFTPTSPSSWWCSTKWCGYARTCPYYGAERASKESE